MSKKSEIKIEVEVDDQHIPDSIHWTAKDAGVVNEASKAMYLSFWDEAEKNTLKLDIWTKEMPVDSMKMFVLQNIALLGEYYKKATNDAKGASEITKKMVELKAILFDE